MSMDQLDNCMLLASEKDLVDSISLKQVANKRSFLKSHRKKSNNSLREKIISILDFALHLIHWFNSFNLKIIFERVSMKNCIDAY